MTSAYLAINYSDYTLMTLQEFPLLRGSGRITAHTEVAPQTAYSCWATTHPEPLTKTDKSPLPANFLLSLIFLHTIRRRHI